MSSWRSHNWNIYSFKRHCFKYPYDYITSDAITEVSNFHPTRNNPQCTTVTFPCHHTLSVIGVDFHILTFFPPNLASKKPLTVQYAHVYNFIGFNFSFILIIKILFFALSVSPPDFRYNTNTTLPLYPSVDNVRTYTDGQRTYTDGQISQPATLDRLDSV